MKDKIKTRIRKQEELWLGKRIIKKSSFKAPDFMVIGAAKSGTTSLFQYLARHPNIIPPRKKELRYFMKHGQKKGLRRYLKNFPLKKEMEGKLTFEGSIYLEGKHQIQRISKTFPHMKFIVIFRDPVERAYSNWNFYHDQSFHKNRTPHHDYRSFEEAVYQEMREERDSQYLAGRFRYLYKGQYSTQLKNFFSIYPQENLLILETAELKNAPKKALKKVTDYLSLPYTYGGFEVTRERLKGHRQKKEETDNHQIKQYNTTPYKQKMSEEIESELKEFYRPFDQELQELTGRKFSWMSK